jgi:cold shock protein
MLTGKVVRFDDVRGYGFIAPDGGGEDVFVHANVLGDDKYVIGPGLRVEFEATDGDRGPKAYAVHLLGGRAAAAPVMLPAPAAQVAPPVPFPPPVATPPVAASAPVAPPETADSSEDGADASEEELCDVLTASVFSQEVTELLLKSAPSLTAAQILDMRAALIDFGQRHSWIEG